MVGAGGRGGGGAAGGAMRLALAAPCAARRHAPTPAVVALGWIMGCSACAFVCGGAGAGRSTSRYPRCTEFIHIQVIYIIIQTM